MDLIANISLSGELLRYDESSHWLFIGSIFIRYILLSENVLRHVSDIGMMPLKFNMFMIFNVSYEIICFFCKDNPRTQYLQHCGNIYVRFS